MDTLCSNSKIQTIAQCLDIILPLIEHLILYRRSTKRPLLRGFGKELKVLGAPICGSDKRCWQNILQRSCSAEFNVSGKFRARYRKSNSGRRSSSNGQCSCANCAGSAVLTCSHRRRSRSAINPSYNCCSGSSLGEVFAGVNRRNFIFPNLLCVT